MKKKLKKLTPGKLWSTSFVTGGLIGLGFNKDGDFSSECYKILQLECIKAYWNDKDNLHLIFKKRKK